MEAGKGRLVLEDGATIVSRLEKLAEEDPDKPAFIFWDKSRKRTVLTRQDVWDKSLRFAAILRQWGVVKGDIVCNTLANSPQRLITMYGTILCGAATMQGQMFLADGEDILANWKDSQCKAVILDPLQKNGPGGILDRIKYTDTDTGTTCYKDLPNLTHLIPVVLGEDATSWDQFLENEEDKFVEKRTSEHDIAIIYLTSGSTGFAKLVPQTHKAFLNTGVLYVYSYDNDTKSICFNHRSFGWIGGSPIAYPVLGNTRVAVDYSKGLPEDAGSFMVEIFNQEKCTCAFLIPSDIQAILNQLDAGNKLDTILNHVVTGGGALSNVTMSAIGRLSKKICGGYASTECGLVATAVVEDPTTYENCCCGRPQVSVECKIVGEDGQDVHVGYIGEIWLRGPNVAKSYLNKPELSKQSFLQDGWFRTSDIGKFNTEGDLFVFCRKSNAINHKGFIHYPGWMESRINRHPHIQKNIVLGIPDPVTHEELCVCLVTSPQSNLTSDDVKDFCKSLYVTSESESITPIPKHVLFFDAFPLNSNGKLDRKVLKTEVMKMLKM